MRGTTPNEGCQVRLRPATLADRAMIHAWSYASDVAPLLHLSEAPTLPLDAWTEDWEAHYFVAGSPERGRMFVVLSPPIGAASTSR